MTKSIELHRRQVGTSALLLLLYIAIFAPTSTNAFTITPFSSALSSSSTSSSFTQSAKPLLSKGQKYSTNQLSSMQSGDDDDKDLSTPPAAKVIEEEEASNVPIDVPSPILLSSSMVLAIASTGCIFEITGGHGTIPSLVITIVGIPASLFLFYAAIQKGIAETEADDAEFQRKNNRF